MEFIHPSIIYLPFYIFTYIYLIHFDVQQKLIHHCKATILQLKGKEKLKINNIKIKRILWDGICPYQSPLNLL